MLSRLVVALVIVGLATIACGGNIQLPDVPTAGPTVVDQISVAVPDGNAARLTFSFGAGELKLAPGSSKLVEGTAEYNVEALKPEIITNGADVQIKIKDVFNLVEPRGIKSKWDLQLGTVPTDLNINAGAYQGSFQFGGLSLTGLTVKDGAAQVDLDFNKPNLSNMTVFRYETGASQVTMTGLANANFSTMILNSGAGDYKLDYSGDLKRDATITISTGLSALKLVVPKGVQATVTAETGMTNVNANGSWTQDANRYSHPGSGPTLTFIIKGGAGSLTLSE